MSKREHPYMTREATVNGWKYEWWQYDGHYILKVWSGGLGGKWRYEGSDRHEGMAPIAPRPQVEPAMPVAAPQVETMKDAIMQREWQDTLRRERSHNDIYSRER